MNKRRFIKNLGLTASTLFLGKIVNGNTFMSTLDLEETIIPNSEGKFELPKLNYSYNSMEPKIDARTMEIHYTKHHQGYVNNLNKAIEGKPQTKWSLEKICANVSASNEAIRNNAGGHYNHSMFWEWIVPNGNSNKSTAFSNAIDANFGSFDQFKDKFNEAAKSRFGSGWVWLVKGLNGKLYVYSTPNQDNPLMTKLGYKGQPLLGLDVWEHAYYLNYQNKRADYINAFWELVNWEKVSELYSK